MNQAVQYLEATQGEVLRVGLLTPSLTGHSFSWWARDKIPTDSHSSCISYVSLL